MVRPETSTLTPPGRPPAEGATQGGPPAGVRRATRPFSMRRREGPWKDALRRRLLAGADLLAAGLAVGVLWASEGAPSALWAALGLPLFILVAKAQGLYDQDHARLRHVTTDELDALFYWATLSVAGIVLGLSLLPVEGPDGLSALLMWAAAFLGAATLRAGARALWRALVPPERAILVGEGPLAEAVARKLTLEGAHHIALVEPGPLSLDANLESVLAERGIERAIVAASDLDEEHLAGVVSLCRGRGVKLSVAPPLRAMLGTAVSLNHLAELPLIEFRTWDASRSTMLMKRTMDITGSGLALLVLSPLLLLIALVVRLDSPGPALFRQGRAGRSGRPFEMLKFRTMVRDAEQRLPEVVDIDGLESPMYKLRSDPRVTRVGRLLRRWSLDELPQLVNVLRGEMSLVGPRPEWTRLVERYDEAQLVNLQMRPGLTGPMQVHGRGELTFSERLAVEREYVENHSLRKDLKILLRTVSVVARGHGAF